MKSAFLTGLRTAISGLALTMRHLRRAGRGRVRSQSVRQPGYFSQGGGQGIVTLQYPHQRLPVPEIGRYKLDCEIDDCIVCDKCARICPVDCIDIVAVKSPQEFGKTSDGTGKRLYAAKFDIDMAKCCYCGLCTTVCPTECLTMQPEYDYTVTDITKMTYAFAQMTPAELTLREHEWAAEVEARGARRGVQDANTPATDAPKLKVPFKPFGNKPKQ